MGCFRGLGRPSHEVWASRVPLNQGPAYPHTQCANVRLMTPLHWLRSGHMSHCLIPIPLPKSSLVFVSSVPYLWVLPHCSQPTPPHSILNDCRLRSPWQHFWSIFAHPGKLSFCCLFGGQLHSRTRNRKSDEGP